MKSLRSILFVLLALGFIVSCNEGGSNPNPPEASGQVTLNVMLNGTGTGTVTSTPAGIDCGGDCEGDFDQDTRVTLEAIPGPNSSFGGWNGACASSNLNGTCVLELDADETVTATFNSSGGGGGGDDDETGGGGGEPQSLSVAVASGTDDAEQFLETAGNVTGGQTDTKNGDLDMVNDIDGNTKRGEVLVGVRFEDVGIPADAEITDAYIQFTAAAGNSGNVTFSINAQANNNAPTFADETNNISSRSFTSTTVSWSPSAWSAGASGEAQQTADVSAILEEVIALGDWNPDSNGVAFVISGDKTSDSGQVRLAQSFNGGSAPELVVTYTSENGGGGGGNTPNPPSPDPAVNSVSIDQEAPKVQVNKTTKLTATVNAENGANESVTWRSNNQNVAIVSSDGTVTGEAAGTATITATSVFDGSRSDSVEVTVTSAPVKPVVNSVTVTPETAIVQVGKTRQLNVSVQVQGGASDDITWSSSDEDIATVNDSGLVDTKAVGDVTITATSDEDSNKSDSAEIEVTEAAPPSVESIDIVEEDQELTVDKTLDLTVTATPDGASTAATWESSAQDVASVNNQGRVKAEKPGSATITATSTDNTNAESSITITVRPKVEGVDITNADQELEFGKKLNLTLEVTPAEANNAVDWTSSSKDFATVSDEGVVTAVAPGVVIITATSVEDETKNDSIEITVTAASISGTISGPTDSDLSGTVVTACFEGDCGDDRSENTMVTENGSSVNYTIEGLRESKSYTVIARKDVNGNDTADDGDLFGFYSTDGTDPTLVGASASNIDFSATESTPPVESVNVVEEYQILELDKTLKLTSEVAPEGSDKTVTWKSSDSHVVEVNSAGIITAMHTGRATITATSKANPEKNDTVRISVQIPDPPVEVHWIELIPRSPVVQVNKNTALDAYVYADTKADWAVTWSSSNTQIATVRILGGSVAVITGIAEGETQITATSDFDPSVEATVTVTVTTEPVPQRVKVAPETAVMRTGDTTTLTATADEGDNRISWYSTDETIATVDGTTGVVTGVSEGRATIFAIEKADNWFVDIDVEGEFGTATIEVVEE